MEQRMEPREDSQEAALQTIEDLLIRTIAEFHRNVDEADAEKARATGQDAEVVALIRGGAYSETMVKFVLALAWLRRTYGTTLPVENPVGKEEA